MDLNVLYSYSDSISNYDNIFIPAELPWEDVGSLLKLNGKYCMAQFKGNYRKSENYIENTINTITIDVDSGLSIRDFLQKHSHLMFALGTTKSHQKEKNGLVCDRYRVILPLEECFNLSQYEYSLMMSEINRYFNADPACKDIARQFHGHPAAKVIMNQGELFDWWPYLDKAKQKLKIRNFYASKRMKTLPAIKGDAEKFFMFARKKFNRIYVQGNRNNAVANILLWAKKENINYEIVCQTLGKWVMSSDDPLPAKELEAMFKYHRR